MSKALLRKFQMLKTKLHAYIFKIYKMGNKKGLGLVMFVMVYSLLAVTTLTACYKQNGGVYLCNGDERYFTTMRLI